MVQYHTNNGIIGRNTITNPMIPRIFIETVKSMVQKKIEGKLPPEGDKLLDMYVKEFITEPSFIVEYRV